MSRRRFCKSAAALLLVSGSGLAQTGKTHRVGLGFQVTKTVAQPLENAFVAGLREHGYVVGRNLVVDVRYADGDAGRLPAIVDELIALKPDVLAGFESIAHAMSAKTSTIPIVLTSSSNPVGNGLAQSLARPGGNVTGISTQWEDLPPKVIEILREILPRLKRIGFLFDATYSGSKGLEAGAQKTAHAVGATLVPYYVANRAELEKAFAAMAKTRPDALLIGGGGVLTNQFELIVERCQRLRIPFPTVPGVSNETAQAALFLFGANWVQGYRDAAGYVARILKGARPGDLPIEQPTKFELVINLKTAKAFGLTIPQSVLVRADRVIE